MGRKVERSREEIGRRHGAGWDGRWRGAGRRQEGETHGQNIWYEKLFSIEKKENVLLDDF